MRKISGAALGIALALAATAAQGAEGDADGALKALYQSYWDWQVAEQGAIERADGNLDPGATIPAATPAAQRARAAKAAEFRTQLAAIDRAALGLS